MKTHKDLQVWQKAMDLVEVVYKITSDFPSEEKFGLISQMRRAAVSVPSNIAEGASRGSIKEYIRFLSIARGSLIELETQLLISERLNFTVSFNYTELNSIAKMLSALINSLKKKIH